MVNWPPFVFQEQVLKPADVFNEACRELNVSPHVFANVTQETGPDFRKLGIEVSSKANKRTVRICDLLIGMDHWYPCTLVPIDFNVPDFAREKRWVSGIADLGASLAIEGRFVKNEWVCSNADELESKLNSILQSRTTGLLLMSLFD